jgi:hypothetical protein
MTAHGDSAHLEASVGKNLSKVGVAYLSIAKGSV